MPAWHEDLVVNHLGGQITRKERPEVPSVGFCGLAATTNPRLKRRLKMVIHQLARAAGFYIDHNDGIYLRRNAMDALSGHPAVRTRFITRSDCFLGVAETPETIARMRREYVDNLIDSDYALCLRGYGNFSFRFFEAMSVGSIPALVNTECVLPYDFMHDYREYCVMVPEDRLRGMGQAIREFHARVSPEGYLELRQRIREFWVQWLSPEGFFRNIPLHWRHRSPIV